MTEWNTAAPLETFSSFNATDLDLDQQPRFPLYVRVSVTLVCCLVLAVGVVGNVLVPFVIWKNRELRNSTNIFLLNLSLADLCVLVLCMPKVLVEVHSRPEVWILGKLICLMIPFMELVVAHVSVLTIMSISIERYYAICTPLRAGYMWTKMRALAMILGVWTAAISTASPMFWIVEYTTADYLDSSKVPVCTTMASSLLPKIYFVAKDVIFLIVPFVVLIFLYSVITMHLMRDPCMEKTNSRISQGRIVNRGTDNSNHRARKQVVFMLIVVIVCFFICMLPSCCFRLFIIFASEETILSLGWEVYHNINFGCRILTYINCSINPILYNVMSSKFREAFRKVLGMTVLGRGASRLTIQRTQSTRSSRHNSGLRTELMTLAPAAGVVYYGRKGCCAIGRRASVEDGRRCNGRAVDPRRLSECPPGRDHCFTAIPEDVEQRDLQVIATNCV